MGKEIEMDMQLICEYAARMGQIPGLFNGIKNCVPNCAPNCAQIL